MIRNHKIFMTGGAGFIGTKLCTQLSDYNNILLYDNLYRNSLKYTKLLEKDNISLVKGNILDFDFLSKTLSEFKPDIIIHLAAIAGIDTVIKSPTNTMKVIMIGTHNILEATKHNISKIERFVNFSTSEVFGSYAYKVKETDSTKLAAVGEARWTYSIAKLAAEHLVHSYHKEFGLPSVTIRPFNVYGPGQIGTSAIHTFIIRAITNQEIQIHGAGDQIRSWCYINDMIQGILLCLEKDEAIGNVFNIGSPKGTVTIISLAEKIVQLANSKSKIVYVPKNYVDVDLRVPSIEKAQRLISYEPQYDLNDGLLHTIEWYKSTLARWD